MHKQQKDYLLHIYNWHKATELYMQKGVCIKFNPQKKIENVINLT